MMSHSTATSPVLTWVAASLGLLLIATTSASASSVVYSTFGPGDTYSAVSGEAVAAAGSVFGHGNDLGVADGFVPASTYTLDGIRIAAFTTSGSPNEIDFSLTTDAANQPSGLTLESWVFTGLTHPGAIFSAASLLHPTLTAGDLYWLVASVPQSGSTEDGWFDTDPPVIGPTVESFNGKWLLFSTIDGQQAFEIDGSLASTSTSVPEPGTLGLTVLGLAGVVRRGRRRTP